MTIEKLAQKKCKENFPEMRAWRAGYVEGAEYIIVKAIKRLYDHRDDVQTEDNGISGWIPDAFIMDFKQAMEA